MTFKFLCVSCLCCVTLAAQDRGVLNREMPSWIDLGVQTRFRAEGQRGLGFRSDAGEDYLLQRYRFSVGVRPAGWLQFFGEMQDARAAWLPVQNGSIRDRLDVRQLWIGVGSETGLWDLKAGRQRLAFGSERVVGASEWGNTTRVFDAVRLGLHRGSNRVDFFSGSVVNPDVDGWDHHLQGNNLHGIYGSLGSIVPDAKVEPYLLLRTSPSALREFRRPGKYHSWTGGIRTAGAVKQHWTYEVELIGQRGAMAGANLAAWAATLQVRRLFPSACWQPEILAEGNYASGDKDSADGVVNTFDQLYPTNHGIYGITDQVGRRNTKNVRAGLSLHPEKWLTVKAEAHSFWLASRYDALYAAGGSVSVPAPFGGAASTDVGRELDFIAELKLSRYYNIGMQAGHLFPGEFLRTYTPGAGRWFYAVYLDLHL